MARPADDLVFSARCSLAEAALATTPERRYAAAHLSALRAAAAVLAARCGPRRGRVRSVWALLPQAAPELAEWAQFFASGARTRAAAEAGLPCVSTRAADDLVREAESFLGRVCDTLGMVHQPPLAMTVPI